MVKLDYCAYYVFMILIRNLMILQVVVVIGSINAQTILDILKKNLS